MDEYILINILSYKKYIIIYYNVLNLLNNTFTNK